MQQAGLATSSDGCFEDVDLTKQGNAMKQLTLILEAIGKAKNMIPAEFSAVMEALIEKAKSSQDLNTAEKQEMVWHMEVLQQEAITPYVTYREEAVDREREAAEEAIDARHGFSTSNGFSIPAWGY